MALNDTTTQILEDSIRQIIGLFDDPKREGLIQTPARVARMYDEFFSRDDFKCTVFEANGYDEMIVQSGINFFSLCEHHMLPFIGDVTIGYVPDKKIIGLSKLPRTVEHFSKRLQVQERMTIEIADFLSEHLKPKGVGVIIKARHLCMELRGVRKVGAETTTSALRGVFLNDLKAREEFLNFRQ